MLQRYQQIHADLKEKIVFHLFCGFFCICPEQFWNQNFAVNTSLGTELSFAGTALLLQTVRKGFSAETHLEVLFVPP